MVSRRPMDPGGTGGSLQRRQALCQKGNQEPRQYIAAAACGHAGIAGVIFIPPGSVGHHRLVTLQEHHRPQAPGQGPCGGHPVRPHSASQAAELSIVGREHRGSLPHIPHIRRSLQHIQPIGVQNHRAPCLLQHRFHHRPNPRRPAQSRTHQTGVAVL